MRALLIAALLAGCGSLEPAEPATGVSAEASGDEAPPQEVTRARIGIPSELRPDDPDAVGPLAEEPPVEEPPAEEAPAEEAPAAEPVTSDALAIAGWTYLREARQHVAHTYRADIQGCFDEAFRRGPRAGRLVIAMVPHADGRVASSRVIENETADDELGECVIRAARGWQLPTPPRRTLEVQLRFTV